MIESVKIEDKALLLPLLERIDSKNVESRFLDIFASSFLKAYVYKEEEKIVSYLLVREEGEEVEIDEVATLPSEEGKGYATKLLKEYLSSLEKGCKVFLEVRSKNHRAISLYEKLGFQSYRVRKNYYDDDDAYCYMKVMK